MYKSSKAKDILTIKTYLTIKYILIDNNYSKGVSIILDPQTSINRIDIFVNLIYYQICQIEWQIMLQKSIKYI